MTVPPAPFQGEPDTGPEGPAPVRFDDARPLALIAAREVTAGGLDVLLIRDVLGRFTLLADDRSPASGAVPDPAAWSERLAADLGRYASDRPLLLASTTFSAAALLASPRTTDDFGVQSAPGSGRVRFLDNTVVGEDWSKVRTPESLTDGVRTSRTALYGFKGGVGRTTATAMLAHHLADAGRTVLVVDLDLESPGAGPLLTDGGKLPTYGIVDQLVESALGNAEGLDLVAPAAYTPLSGGELWVAPARGAGAQTVAYSYVDKLNRVYADAPGSLTFADRLENAVRACEDAVRLQSQNGRGPDVVLLDSRAGIHDIAAVTISRLCDLALLFGADNQQTWTGYGDLFTAWRDAGQAAAIREKLRMVASMVPSWPERPQEAYLETFREHALNCFSVLYDDVPGVRQADGDRDEGGQGAGSGVFDTSDFMPPLEDDSAPHYALPILFDIRLVGLDASQAPGWQDDPLVKASYAEFLHTSTRLILEGLS
ncbi:KGGVGR-motif variant AAA ATPase [Streptomyces sp. D54]|uniref:KGGVGR-motif variant AAA ATPase n=1 Tax=Streptomyces sp. D54 TaxID=1290289 RepID=UPI003CF9AD13